VSHRRAHANRRKHHHVVCKLKHHLRETLHGAYDRLAFATHGGNRQCEEHAERDDLQNVATNHRFNDAGRKRVDYGFDERLRMSVLNGLDGGRVRRFESHSDARLGEINHGQSDEQRDCSDDLEIDQCLESHAPDFAQRAGTCDPYDDRRENKRRDDRFDQVNENVAQKIDRVAPIRP
jgi:hypothetical protein